METLLAAATFVILSTYHTILLKATPAQLMLPGKWYQEQVGLWFINNGKSKWKETIRKKKCAHLLHTYKVGDQALLKKSGKFLNWKYPVLDHILSNLYTLMAYSKLKRYHFW